MRSFSTTCSFHIPECILISELMYFCLIWDLGDSVFDNGRSQLEPNALLLSLKVRRCLSCTLSRLWKGMRLYLRLKRFFIWLCRCLDLHAVLVLSFYGFGGVDEWCMIVKVPHLPMQTLAVRSCCCMKDLKRLSFLICNQRKLSSCTRWSDRVSGD